MQFHHVDANNVTNEQHFESPNLRPARQDAVEPLHHEEPATLSVENMVDDLVGANPGSRRSSQLQSSLNPSSEPAPRPATLNFTVQDLVRQLKSPAAKDLPGPNGLPEQSSALPGVWQTAFTPRPGDDLGVASSYRPGTARSQLSPKAATIAPSSGAIEFHQQLHQNMQARTSPTAPFEPTQSPYNQTPSGFNTFVRQQYQQGPWDSSLPTSPGLRLGSGQSNNSSASPYGAIGERPRTAKTPTSAQPAP
jgi:hypothetical protein